MSTTNEQGVVMTNTVSQQQRKRQTDELIEHSMLLSSEEDEEDEVMEGNENQNQRVSNSWDSSQNDASIQESETSLSQTNLQESNFSFIANMNLLYNLKISDFFYTSSFPANKNDEWRENLVVTLNEPVISIIAPQKAHNIPINLAFQYAYAHCAKNPSANALILTARENQLKHFKALRPTIGRIAGMDDEIEGGLQILDKSILQRIHMKYFLDTKQLIWYLANFHLLYNNLPANNLNMKFNSTTNNAMVPLPSLVVLDDLSNFETSLRIKDRNPEPQPPQQAQDQQNQMQEGSQNLPSSSAEHKIKSDEKKSLVKAICLARETIRYLEMLFYERKLLNALSTEEWKCLLIILGPPKQTYDWIPNIIKIRDPIPTNILELAASLDNHSSRDKWIFVFHKLNDYPLVGKLSEKPKIWSVSFEKFEKLIKVLEFRHQKAPEISNAPQNEIIVQNSNPLNTS